MLIPIFISGCIDNKISKTNKIRSFNEMFNVKYKGNNEIYTVYAVYADEANQFFKFLIFEDKKFHWVYGELYEPTGKKFNKVVKKTEIIDLLKGRSFTIRNFDK